MDKRQKEIITRLKRNTDNQFYVDLLAYLNSRLEAIQVSLLHSTNDDESKRLQGRGLELDEFIQALIRKPVDVQRHTGSFN